MQRHLVLAAGVLSILFAGNARAGVLSAVSDWTANGQLPSAHLGWSQATAGDVNGDGFSDVIIGAYNQDLAVGRGVVFVYHGSAGGLGLTPDWTTVAADNDTNYGAALATAGDVNGDGYSDVLVGASNSDHGGMFMGTVYLYHGSPGGLSLTPDWTDQGTAEFEYFGGSVATAGDVNQDGFSDVLVGAHGYENTFPSEGAAFLYLGAADGLSAEPAWTFEGGQGGAHLGNSLSTAGDVDGDGFSDVIIGAHWHDNQFANQGAAYGFHGCSSGLPATPDWMVEGQAEEFKLGEAVSFAGDVNGDGYSDVIVGVRDYENGQAGEGAALVFHGSPAGLEALPAWQVEGEQDNATLGMAVATAGDVNGDGYADVAVGAPFMDYGDVAEGAGFVYLGSATGLSALPAWTAYGDQLQAWYGISIGTVGDVNGDGFSDLMAGAGMFDSGTGDEGAAYLYYGSGEGPADVAAWTYESGQDRANLGHNVQFAGDVNGDGYADVIAGAAGYRVDLAWEGAVLLFYGSEDGLADVPDWIGEGNQGGSGFGNAVAAAGDVNGDGYADIIVGGWAYDNGTPDIGRASLFFGSPAGPSASPDWEVESDQELSWFGWSVNTVGDLNGDGYSDIAVGAKLYDNPTNNEGEAYVYLGGPDGPSLTPDWWKVGDQEGAEYGDRVATAGDVNADGFSDLVIGALTYDNGQGDEGRVYVYHGGPGGPSETPDWMAEGNSFGANFGHWVNSAGDVNGDGYSDLAIGARSWDEVASNAGRALVYLGGPAGLKDTPHWEGLGSMNAEYYGDAIATAGDVNGDGYSDILVCGEGWANPESNEGRVDLHLGGPGGLSATPDWTIEGNVAEAWLGDSVNTAGDVNGDGFDDFVIGADKYTGSINEEGKIYLYYGNRNPGRPLLPRQMAVSQDLLVQPLGLTDSVDSVRLMLQTLTPAGRTRVRFISEVKPLGAAFDMSDLRVTAFFDSGLAVGLGRLVDGLSPDTPHHWRARLQYFPYMNYGKWVSGGGPNAWNETDFRTSTVCTPTGLDEVACDGVDDDCDGITDEDYPVNDGCGIGYCNINNTPSYCTLGNEFPCEPAGPLGPEDSTCDLIDDDCDGLTDEEADIDCDDGRACTNDECFNGSCINQHISGCLIEDACLADGADHPTDSCRACRPEVSGQDWSPKEPGSVCGESSCEGGVYHPPPTCDPLGTCVPGASIECASGQCADSSECLGAGSLLVSLGGALEPGTRVVGDVPRVVMRLNFLTDQVGGTLDSLGLVFPGLEEVPYHWRWVRVSLYRDAGPNSGEIDGSAEPVGTVWLQNGQAVLSGLELALPAMTSTDVLIGMSVVNPSKTASAALLFPLGLLLAGLLLSGRRSSRRIRLVVALLLIAALYSCTRYGYYQNSFPTRAVLEDVGVRGQPGDTLTVDGPPLEGDEFILDVSR